MDAARYGRWEAVPRRGYLPDRGCNSTSWRHPGSPRGSRSEHAADNGHVERRSIRGRTLAVGGFEQQASSCQGSVDGQAAAADVGAPVGGSSKGDGGGETEEALSVAGRYRRRARVPRRGRLSGRNDDDAESALVSHDHTHTQAWYLSN